jgi:dephospho-CoA kinase
MSPGGIKRNKHTIKFLSKEDRDKAIIILVKAPFFTRMKRLRQRGWSIKKIISSVINDYKLFKGFTDYDKIITSNK